MARETAAHLVTSCRREAEALSRSDWETVRAAESEVLALLGDLQASALELHDIVLLQEALAILEAAAGEVRNRIEKRTNLLRRPVQASVRIFDRRG